ncbi:MAG: hypothetical protein L3J28_06165 [Candidatus Polarisedimenticolaceae bacterium]|nr:hypothetical protein [Candidatus Polarisedimenticolaceae bacterium]
MLGFILHPNLRATDEERQAAYRALFRHRLAERTLEALREATNKAWVLGDDRFKAEIESKVNRHCSPKARGGDRKSCEFQKKHKINRV